MVGMKKKMRMGEKDGILMTVLTKTTGSERNVDEENGDATTSVVV